MAQQLYRTLTGQSHHSHHSHHSEQSHARESLNRTTSADPLTGTLNHLTVAQEQKLVEFKEALKKDGWWTPDGVNGKASHDDGTLLRYLRARKFDLQGAIGQFTDTEKWMKEQQVVELYDHFDVETYERARLMYPQWTGHRDKRGIPIYVYVIKGLDGKNVSKYQKESQAYKDSLPYHKKLATPAKLIPLFALYQNLLNFVLPFVSTLERPNPEVPVTTSTNIVDISGVGLTQFWNLKAHMQDASVLATAHYPETLDRIFIIGAPAFFPTVWGWIKRWFDPVTVSKIFILGRHEVTPTLSKFMELKDIPEQYGGTLKWNWGELPDLDEETRNALEKDGNKGWVRGPCVWVGGQRLVVGSEKGKLRSPDEVVQKRMPIVYAADYTEVPVHEDKNLSSILQGAKGSAGGEAPAQLQNGTAEAHQEAHATTAAATGATVASVIATETESNANPPAATAAAAPPSSESAAPAPAPAASEPAKEAPSATAEPTLNGTTSAPAPEPANTDVAPSGQGESAVAVPPTANGTANGVVHPDIVITNNTSKEIVVETEKLALDDAPSEKERPQVERFVTAATEVGGR